MAKTKTKPAKVLVQVRVDAREHERFTRMCKHYRQPASQRLRGLITGALRDGYPLIVAKVGKKSLSTHAIVEGHGREADEDGTSSYVVYEVVVLAEEAEGFLPEATAKGATFELPMCTPLTFTLHRCFRESLVWRLRLVEKR